MVIKVIVVGAKGKMGSQVIKGLTEADDMKVIGAVDINNVGEDLGITIHQKLLGITIHNDLEKLLQQLTPDVIVDFTRKESAMHNINVALKKGVSVVVGTTGFSEEDLTDLDKSAKNSGVGLFIAPNFSLGAVMMIKCAQEVSKYFFQSEIIEYHNDKKVDSPSGTALATAQALAGKEGKNKESNDKSPCRGGEYGRTRIHSVRLNSLVAHQEVIFSGLGELLTIRHDTFSREAFMPGILLALRKVRDFQGLKIGLENIL